MRPPSGLALFYDNDKSKDKTMRRVDNASNFSKSTERPSQVKKHTYNINAD